MRKLATVEVVKDLRPIPDADNIEVATIRGWDVVVRKGEFREGDTCVYFEIDSLLPLSDERFGFLMNRGVRTDVEGNVGHVLKTARLRGQYSQGLAMPIETFGECMNLHQGHAGTDVTELLGVVKWEPPIPAQLSGQVIGLFPSWIPKTDEERLQNISEILDIKADWWASEKLDGSSMTAFLDRTADENQFGVCSRNMNLYQTEENTFWKLAQDYDLEALLRRLGPLSSVRVAIQGEAFGEGIQKNPLKVKGQRLSVFAFHVDGERIPRREWPAELHDLAVPQYPLDFPQSVSEALEQVEDLKSLVSPERAAEGVVWTAQDRTHEGNLRLSFKVISRKYLSKDSDR